jgi:hypothetical protein
LKRPASLAPGAPEEKARAAAAALTTDETRFSKIDNRLAKIEARLQLLTWVVSFAIAMLVAVVSKLFLHA